MIERAHRLPAMPWPSLRRAMAAPAEALFKMTLGNRIGVTAEQQHRRGRPVRPRHTARSSSSWRTMPSFRPAPIRSRSAKSAPPPPSTCSSAAGETLDLDAVQEAWESGIESVFPYRSKGEDKVATVETIELPRAEADRVRRLFQWPSPRVVIPVFPGNNCEYDSAARLRACRRRCDDH